MNLHSSLLRRLLASFAFVALTLAAAAQIVPPDGSVRFLVVGDWGRRRNSQQQEVADQMGRTAAAIHSQFVVSVGDNFYDVGVKSVEDPLWKTYFEDVYTAPSLQTPWYVSLGNHDYLTNPEAEVEYTLFSPRWKMPRRYYNFVVKLTPEISAEFFVTDTSPIVSSYHKPGSKYAAHVAGQDSAAQIAWLEQKLAASTAQWKIVVGHHAVYSSSDKHGDTEDLIRLFRPLFEKYGVQAYLNGHDHHSEVVKDGPVVYITAGGGAEARGTAIARPITQFIDMEHPAFLSVTIQPETFDYAFIDQTGGVLFKDAVSRTTPAK